MAKKFWGSDPDRLARYAHVESVLIEQVGLIAQRRHPDGMQASRGFGFTKAEEQELRSATQARVGTQDFAEFYDRLMAPKAQLRRRAANGRSTPQTRQA